MDNKKEKLAKIYLYLAGLFITSLVVSNLIFQNFFIGILDIEIFDNKLFEHLSEYFLIPLHFNNWFNFWNEKKAKDVVITGIFASFFQSYFF